MCDGKGTVWLRIHPNATALIELAWESNHSRDVPMLEYRAALIADGYLESTVDETHVAEALQREEQGE